MKDGVFEVPGFGVSRRSGLKRRSVMPVGESAAGSGAGMAVEQGCSCICAAEVLLDVVYVGHKLGQKSQKPMTDPNGAAILMVCHGSH